MKQPNTKVQKSLSEDERNEHTFTGLARSVEAYDNQGFRNFRIVTLHLVNGRVVNTEYSDPYASFEAISRMEMANELAVHHLNNNWKNGAALAR